MEMQTLINIFLGVAIVIIIFYLFYFVMRLELIEFKWGRLYGRYKRYT